MPRWTPDPAEIDNREAIGRRIYGDKVFDGQGPRLRVDHFMDERLAQDLSVDRLGLNNPEKQVKRYLKPIAAAANNTKSFTGWAALKVSSIRNRKYPLDILATPQENNEYHADISRNNIGNLVNAYSLAFRLRDCADKDFGFVKAPA